MRLGHGYDYASNPTWREDAVAAANSEDFDEFYTYDGLRQLTGLDRGDLKSGKSGIDGSPFHEEDFGLDPRPPQESSQVMERRTRTWYPGWGGGRGSDPG